MQRFVAATLALSTLLASGLASAAPTLAEKATAQALFEDGLKLMGAKHYAEACPKLEESERLDPALGTRFRLSECEEAVGRFASAWAGYLEVADLAHAAGQADREALARQKAASLAPKLSKINIIVTQPDTSGLEVSRDHVAIGRGQWGTPVPIDPGTYAVTATAPQKKPWTGNVTVAGDGQTATLTVPALDVAAATPAIVPPVTTPDEHAGSSTTKILGFTLAGVGVAGMGTGVVLGFVAKSNYNGAGCGASTCTSASSESALNSARSLANVGTGVFIAEAVAAAGGVVLVLVAPRSRPGSSQAAVHLGPGTAMLTGSF